MNLVEPIRDKAKIEEFKTELLRCGYKYYMMFTLGINTGLRISDIVPLKKSDVTDKTHISLKETKTRKMKKFFINDKLKFEIDKYCKTLNHDDYLFPSQRDKTKHISRMQAYRMLNQAAERCHIPDIGTHTMRKTFGYWHYQQYRDIAVLQTIFNHSKQSITMRYIGLTQDIIDQTIEKFYL